jgi:hypothetical protein
LLSAEQVPISIDGSAADWAGATVAHTDPAGDGGGSGIDLRRLWLSDDERSLFVRFETTAEIDLSENNALRIYLDTDANGATGLAVNGIGAELEWRFGERVGFFRIGGTTVTVDHAAVVFRAGPTVTGSDFEMSFGLDAIPDGVHPLFPGPMLRLVVRENGGDQLPGPGTLVTYTLGQGELPREAAVPLERQSPGDVRLLTYNVGNDGLWSPAKQDGFRRQLVAAGPDIICFQEIYAHSGAETRALIASWLPPGAGGAWHWAANADCKTISRHPIIQSWPIGANLAALIDTSEPLGTGLLVINAHLPCCENEAQRQAEIDAILAFLRDARSGGGGVSVPRGTAILISGDLNLVGFAQQLESLALISRPTGTAPACTPC